MKITKLRELVSKVKYIYILVYMVCFAAFNNAYINLYFHDITSVAYKAVIFSGIVILIFDFFTFSTMLKTKYSTLLILFYIVCAVSILLNFKYDPIANLKVIVWMLIQTFILASIDRSLPREHHVKHFRLVSEAVALVFFINAAWSLVMFIRGINGTIPNPQSVTGTVRIGFVDGRLFGVFTDPNYASVCVLFTMFMIACNMFSVKEGMIRRIYHIVLLLVDFIYVLLSRSRTSEIGIIASMCIIGFFVAKRWFEKRGLPKLARTLIVILTVLIVLIGVGGYLFTEVVNRIADDIYIAMRLDENMSEEEREALESEVERPDIEGSSDITNLRSAIWKDYFEVFRRNFLFGTGPRNGLAYAGEHMPQSFIVERQYSCHNGYLAVLVGSGIVGFVLVITYIILVAVKLLRYLFRESKTSSTDYIPVVMLSCVLAVGAVSALPLLMLFFNNSVSDAIFWFVLGYVLYLIDDGEDDKKSVVERATDFFRAKQFRS